MSFIADKIVMDGLTYDDVLLIPAYSEVLPRTVDLTTKFSRNIELKIPFVTAAMDTVTEAKMAIAIAREGGIGVIHKNMSIEEQARQVAIVKRAENGMIYDPVTIKRGSTVRDALALMAEYKIGGMFSMVLPVKGRAPKDLLFTRKIAMEKFKEAFEKYGVKDLFAYNGAFDKNLLNELASYRWFDIMKIAAYRQYNDKIPASIECCKTGK